MGKIYELYPKEQRKIDNQARRIRGYEKMRRDLQSTNRKLNRENRDLQQRIDEAIEYIEKNELNGNKISEMLCGSEIVALLEILKESNK